MVMEREEGQTADAVASRLAALIEPGSLLEATPECLVVAHADGRILFANHRVEQLTGFDRRDLVGQSVELLIATDILELVPGTRLETICRTNDLGEIPVEIHLGTIEAPERLLVVSLRDVSDLKAGREARIRGRGQVPGAGRADPGGRLPGPGRRELGLDLRESAGGDAARDRPGRVADRSVLLAQARPSRRPRPSLGGVRRRLQQPHDPRSTSTAWCTRTARFKWVLEQAYPINDEHGNPWLIQGVIFDISAAQGRRGAGRVPGLPRQAHRPAEPCAVRGDARERHHPRSPPRSRRRRPVPGPGQLQARERLAGPPRRRRPAGAARRAPAGLHARDRHGGSPGRRRVPAAALGPGARRRPDRREPRRP